MALNQRRKVIAAKIESVYKTDPVPTAAANAMLVRNWKWTPLKLVTDPRELVLPYLRAFEKLVVAGYGTASFEVEMAGSGAAGTAPPWGVLMRACGLSETINAGVDVQYKPASTAFESVTIYFYHEGLLYKLIGVRGTCGLRMNARQVPVFTFEMTGVYVAVTDVALPSPTLTSWQKPLPVSNTNTTGLTLHAFATGVMRSLAINMNNDVKYRQLVGAEDVQIVDRDPNGSISLETVTVATKDWWTIAKAGTLGALSVVQGTVAGNKVQIDCPQVQLIDPDLDAEEGISFLNMNLGVYPNTGNDEVTIKAF